MTPVVTLVFKQESLEGDFRYLKKDALLNASAKGEEQNRISEDQ